MDISRIVLNPATQLRLKVSEERVKEYAEAMSEGANFPAVVVFGTDEEAILSDGWHRIEAALLVGRTEINADVRSGTLEDAIWYALGANAHHGLSYSTAEKQKNIEIALKLRPGESNRAIARQCGVSDKTVGERRSVLVERAEIPHVSTRRGDDGKEYPAPPPRSRPKVKKPAPQPTPPSPVDEDDGEIEEEDEEETGPRPISSSQSSLPLDPRAVSEPTLGQMVANGQMTLPPMPEETAEEKAFYRLGELTGFSKFDPVAIAEASTKPSADLLGYKPFLEWYGRFIAALEARASRPMRVVGGGR